MLTRQAKLFTKVPGTKTLVESRTFLGGIFGKDGKSQDTKSISTEATFDWNAYKLHQLDEGPATSSSLTRDEGLRIYHEMVTIRRMETAAANLYKEGHQGLLSSLLRPGGRVLRYEGRHS